MNKKAIIIVIVVVALLGGGALVYANDQSNKKEAERMAMEKSESETMEKHSGDDAMAKDEAKTEDAMEGDAMAKQGNYVTLADYDADPGKYAETKKVYFFHASWCPTCQAIDKEINQDPSKIPAGVTIIKTDYDSQTDLRKKYGVTYQYTFVQVDNDGNETNQYTASSLDKVIAGIQS